MQAGNRIMPGFNGREGVVTDGTTVRGMWYWDGIIVEESDGPADGDAGGDGELSTHVGWVTELTARDTNEAGGDNAPSNPAVPEYRKETMY